MDGVCAAVVSLENNALFNAGHGASLTEDGNAEMDAAVMSGDGHAGAIAASQSIRNPILGARAVMEKTRHVLLVNPGPDLASQWETPTAPREYFVTDARRRQLKDVLNRPEASPNGGTVGAVALDAHGRIACATSTGGMAGKAPGRVGDTCLIGAGSYASESCAAISCTGEGEAYIEGVVAHDIAARIRYGRLNIQEALQQSYGHELDTRHATGGTIALTPDGDALIAYNSSTMLAGYWDAGQHVEVFV
jgi:beta-aspartyl-peptidase (threonine type)